MTNCRIWTNALIAVMLIFLIQGVYCIQFSSSSGDGKGSSYVTTNLNAANDATVNGQVSISGSGITPILNTKGSIKRFSQTHHVTDTTGKHATVSVDVVNAPNGLSYSDQVLPGEGNVNSQPLVSDEQWLTVPKADSIICTASASYGTTLSAGTGILETKGLSPRDYVTLIGYDGKASASDTQVSAVQTATSGSGKFITVSGDAKDSSGTYSVNTPLSGSFNGLSASSLAGTSTQVSQAERVIGPFISIATAPGGKTKIRTSNYGSKYDLNMLTAEGSSPTGSVGYYVDPSMATKTLGAIQGAVNAAQTGDTINAAAGRYKENIVIDKGGLLSIIGVGKDRTIVDGGAAGSVFTIANEYQTPVGSTITLSGITITNGNVGIDATGTTLNLNDVMITGNAYSGIATQLGGPVTMNGHSSIADNTGIGISVDKGSSVIMNDHSSITGNTGGGIGGWYSQVTMNDHSSISGNRADYGGGIYLVYGDVTMNDHSSITNNAAVNIGGGIYIAHPNGGWVNMNGYSSIAGNTAANGGGIYIANGDSVNMNGHSSIAGNTAATGGGIYNQGTVNMNGRSSITYNTATSDGGGIYNLIPGYAGSVNMYSGSSIISNTANNGGGIYNTQGTINFLDSQGNIIPGYDPKNNDYLHFFGPTINGPDNKPNDVAP